MRTLAPISNEITKRNSRSLNMTLLQTVLANVTFIDVCNALIVVAIIERLFLRFAPDSWLDSVGITA